MRSSTGGISPWAQPGTNRGREFRRGTAARFGHVDESRFSKNQFEWRIRSKPRAGDGSAIAGEWARQRCGLTQTQRAIRKELDDAQFARHALDNPAKTLSLMTAFILGSPEFRRR